MSQLIARVVTQLAIPIKDHVAIGIGPPAAPGKLFNCQRTLLINH
jgi:hypothetical protein